MKQNTRKITEFFKSDYVDQASYDNLRKIASLVDGQKNAARKIIYTILQKNIKEKIKVSQLGSKVAEFAEYLHGNMDGVIVNLAQDFVGSNNLSLLQKKGNFGTRFAQESSASRYIFTYGSENLFNLFRKEDNNILVRQFFEGQEIEPVFYVPNLPVLLINGSEGVSSGFAQKILPRDPKVIKDYIISSFNNDSLPSLPPFYKGFKGTIEQGETPAQWLIKGSFDKISNSRILITEVPIGYDLKSYIDVLDDLEDKKIILSYKDKSEDDDFKFEVNIGIKALSEWDDETILTKLKLIKKVSENYTCMNEHNKIEVFKDIYEIINRYIAVKMKYFGLRKEYLLKTIEEQIKSDFSRYTFIKSIVEEKLIISKRKKSEIELDLVNIAGIIKKDDSYDYLLNMNLLSLTEERMQKLESDIRTNKEKLDSLKIKDVKDIWKEEI
jgi:DNA topoisomerase-2